MATSRRRQEQEGKDFKERYKIRSGIEATVSEAARVTGLKRVWCRGLSRVRAAVSFKALAINIKRYIAAELEKAARGQSGGAPGLRFRLFHVLVMVQQFFRCQSFAQPAWNTGRATQRALPGKPGSYEGINIGVRWLAWLAQQ